MGARDSLLRAIENSIMRASTRNRLRFTEVTSDKELEDRVSPIRLGNREDREKRVYYESLDSGDYCDCCGASLIKKPWVRNFGLCDGCMRYMKQHDFPKSKMPNHMSSKEMTMQPDRRKNPFRRV